MVLSNNKVNNLPAPGMVPKAISGCPNLALSPHIIMSHIIASSQPPPS